eukprot:4199176-Amphidinium_carterae.2
MSAEIAAKRTMTRSSMSSSSAKKDDDKKFHEQLGNCLKLGILKIPPTESRLQSSCAFTVIHTPKSDDEQINLKEYVDRMKEGQYDIYCIAGESIAQVSSSPFLETLHKKGYEVLYVIDTLDEYAVQQLKEFDGKKLKSTTKAGLEIDDEDEKKKLEELKVEIASLTKPMKEVFEKVVISSSW